jgi:type IV secretory pathway protease TraF
MWRARLLALAGTVLSGLSLMRLIAHPHLLAINQTPSLPQGVYGLSYTRPITHGSLVVVQPTPDQATWLATQGYLAPDMPLLKPVVALAGDTVCGDTSIRVNGVVVGPGPRSRDPQGRNQPQSQG